MTPELTPEMTPEMVPTSPVRHARATRLAIALAAVAALALLVGPACSHAKQTIVDRATGTWLCASDGTDRPIDVAIDRNGAFSLREVGSAGPGLRGSWSLAGTRLAVQVPRYRTPIRVSGFATDATELRLVSWFDRRSTSKVSYREGVVTIRDASPGSTTWRCTRTTADEPRLPPPGRLPSVSTTTTEPPPTTPSTIPPDEVLEPVDGIWFRFTAAEVEDPETHDVTRPEIDLTFLEDGRVISVGQSDIYASVDDYTTFTLTPAALDQLVDMVRTSGVLKVDNREEDEPDSALSYGDGFVREPVPAEVADKLADLSWLDDGVSASTPWVPDEVELEVRTYEPDEDVQEFDRTVQAWPLPTKLRAGTRCVRGDDAAKVFALMTSDVTNVRIRVDDGSGVPWEVGVRPIVPGQGSESCD